jgi:putative hemolysin
MTPGETLLWVVVSLVGVAGSFLCSGMEIGYYTMNRLRLRVAAAGGARAAVILHRLTEQPDRVLTGLLVGNNIFNYLSTLGVTTLLVRAEVGEVMVVVISAAIVTPALLIFAEALPKDVFRVEADTLMPRLAGALRGWLAILSATGVPALLSVLARAIGRTAGAAQDDLTRDARARVAALLKEGAFHGLLSASQTTLLDRALIFSRATVADEMTPWSAARPVRASASAREAARRMAGEWAPVIDAGGAGAPVGVVRRLDLLLADAGGGAVASHMRPLVSLGAGTPLHEAAGQLARGQVGLGVVMRGGRPAGIVTLGDLAEPLTGDLAGW